jgi:preprotein translocase SecE subunit
MADKTSSDKVSKRHKSPETVRERAEKQIDKQHVPKKRIRSRIYRPLSLISSTAKKEYNPLPVPKGRAGRVLGKRVHLVPKFYKEAWVELKKVTWPSWGTALKLTLAVIVFAAIFSIFVQFFGYIFEKLFRYIFTG